MTFCSLWVNEASYVLNTIISLVIMGTGVFTLFQGIKATTKLERIRKKLLVELGEPEMAKKNFFSKCIGNDPNYRQTGGGMTTEQFIQGCSQMAGVEWKLEDAKNIFNA